MLCTFETATGSVIVQSEDIKAIEDRAVGQCQLIWSVGTEIFDRRVLGTALDNMARIQQEELDLVSRVEMHRMALQQRYQAGLPNPPVKRGKA